MKKTEDLIRKLSQDRRKPRWIWPIYPALPMLLTLILSLAALRFVVVDAYHAFLGPMPMNLPDWAPGLIIALVGASLRRKPWRGGAECATAHAGRAG